MYILVVGCGTIGRHLTKGLLAAGHEVLVTERDAARVAELFEEVGSVALVGDGTEYGVLKEAGAERADILVATTGSDADNLVACQVAKHAFKVPRTLALVNNPRNQALFLQLGVDVPISSTDVIMKNIEEEIPDHSLVHVLNLAAGRRIVVIRVPPDGAALGLPMSAVRQRLPANSLPSLVIHHSGAPEQVTDDLTLQAEDQVVCLTTDEEEDALRRSLTQVS